MSVGVGVGARARVHTYMCAWVCMCACMCACVRAGAHVLVRLPMRLRKGMCACVRVGLRVRARVRVRAYACARARACGHGHGLGRGHGRGRARARACAWRAWRARAHAPVREPVRVRVGVGVGGCGHGCGCGRGNNLPTYCGWAISMTLWHILCNRENAGEIRHVQRISANKRGKPTCMGQQICIMLGCCQEPVFSLCSGQGHGGLPVRWPCSSSWRVPIFLMSRHGCSLSVRPAQDLVIWQWVGNWCVSGCHFDNLVIDIGAAEVGFFWGSFSSRTYRKSEVMSLQDQNAALAEMMLRWKAGRSAEMGICLSELVPVSGWLNGTPTRNT